MLNGEKYRAPPPIKLGLPEETLIRADYVYVAQWACRPRPGVVIVAFHPTHNQEVIRVHVVETDYGSIEEVAHEYVSPDNKVTEVPDWLTAIGVIKHLADTYRSNPLTLIEESTT